MTIKKHLTTHQFFMCMAILALGLLIQLRSGQFFHSNNLVDMIRACITPCTFAIGVYMVIISGGIDLSFPGISALASYIVALTQYNLNPDAGSPLVGYIMCFVVGGLIGAFNGFLIGYYRLPALIVTLGTLNIAWGILLGPFNNMTYPIPANLLRWSRTYLFTVTNPVTGVSASVPALAVTAVLFIALAWFIMNRTMVGRGLYAIGGNVDAASRVGFPVLALHIFVYAFSGGLAGVCGYNRVIMTKMLHTVFESGTEMIIIAGVVLGGVRISGGVGTLSGALLGTVFLTILNNSLLMLGLSPYWADAATGVSVILGISITTIQIKLERSRQLRHTGPREAAEEGGSET